MFSLLLGVLLFGCGAVGSFLYHPSLGLAVYAVFTHVTPQQLGVASFRFPFLVAIATLVGYFVSTDYPEKFQAFPAELVLFAIMLLGMLLGTQNAYDSELALEHFYIYCKYGLFLLLLVNIIDSLRKAEIFIYGLIVGAAWLVYKCWDLRGATAGRFENIDGGVVGDSNQFAAALILLTPLVLMRAFQGRKLIRIGALLGFFGMIMSVIISNSRGGFLGLIVLAAALFVFYKRYRKKILLAAVVIVLAVSPFITDHYTSKIASISVAEDEQRDASSQSRIDFWTLAIDVWQRYPLYGCGLRNFTYYNGYENEGKKWGEQGHVAHSLWFEALAEGGLLVFVPLLAMIVLFFRRTARAKRKFISRPEVYADIVALQAGMAGFLVCATFVNRLIYEPIYWWCCLAYVYDRRIAAPETKGMDEDESQVLS